MTSKSTAATKPARLLVAGLGILLGHAAHASPGPDTDSADARATTQLYRCLREARDGNVPAAQRAVDPDEIRDSARDLAPVSLDGEATQPTGPATGPAARARAHVSALVPQYRPAALSLSAPAETPPSDPLTLPDRVFGSDLQLSSNRELRNEILLRNSDASVRARLRMDLGRDWLFLYGDMGSWDSTLKWQGLVGIRVGHGANLVGGWRHVTYYLSPGRDFNSLDSEGPFVGAQRSW